MARSYAGLANMAARFGFRLAKAREGINLRTGTGIGRG
jgi:hypothetical protein